MYNIGRSVLFQALSWARLRHSSYPLPWFAPAASNFLELGWTVPSASIFLPKRIQVSHPCSAQLPEPELWAASRDTCRYCSAGDEAPPCREWRHPSKKESCLEDTDLQLNLDSLEASPKGKRQRWLLGLVTVTALGASLWLAVFRRGLLVISFWLLFKWTALKHWTALQVAQQMC